jgi:hypothetical protein
MAIDYRIRYYFAVTPFKEFMAWVGAGLASDDLMSKLISEAMEDETVRVGFPDAGVNLSLDTVEGFFASLERCLGQLQPPGKRLECHQEEELVRYCLVLALFEEVYRAGRHPESPLFRFGPEATSSELLSITEAHWVDDLCSLSWLFYERFEEVLTHPAILNPVFAGSSDVGGADADFILDGCLFDIKTTINPRVANLWLYQLLGYVFLDYNNQYQIHEVGMYLARQGIILRWTLADLLNQLSGGTAPPLEELRERFQQIVESSNK